MIQTANVHSFLTTSLSSAPILMTLPFALRGEKGCRMDQDEGMKIEQQDAYREYVRKAFEKRLGRAMSDMEFEKLLRIGDGVFWNYDPYGHIHPFEAETLRSNALRWNARKAIASRKSGGSAQATTR
jgi:hypothetical protein